MLRCRYRSCRVWAPAFMQTAEMGEKELIVLSLPVGESCALEEKILQKLFSYVQAQGVRDILVPVGMRAYASQLLPLLATFRVYHDRCILWDIRSIAIPRYCKFISADIYKEETAIVADASLRGVYELVQTLSPYVRQVTLVAQGENVESLCRLVMDEYGITMRQGKLPRRGVILSVAQNNQFVRPQLERLQLPMLDFAGAGGARAIYRNCKFASLHPDVVHLERICNIVEGGAFLFFLSLINAAEQDMLKVATQYKLRIVSFFD